MKLFFEDDDNIACQRAHFLDHRRQLFILSIKVKKMLRRIPTLLVVVMVVVFFRINSTLVSEGTVLLLNDTVA